MESVVIINNVFVTNLIYASFPTMQLSLNLNSATEITESHVLMVNGIISKNCFDTYKLLQ